MSGDTNNWLLFFRMSLRSKYILKKNAHKMHTLSGRFGPDISTATHTHTHTHRYVCVSINVGVVLFTSWLRDARPGSRLYLTRMWTGFASTTKIHSSLERNNTTNCNRTMNKIVAKLLRDLFVFIIIGDSNQIYQIINGIMRSNLYIQFIYYFFTPYIRTHIRTFGEMSTFTMCHCEHTHTNTHASMCFK